MKVVCWLDDTVEDARQTFRETQLNTVFDWGIGGEEPVGLVQLDQHAPWGDESRVYRVELEGKVLGHGVSLRSGKRTLHARLEGLLRDDFSLWRVFQDVFDELEEAERG
jgi:hypothetical protein